MSSQTDALLSKVNDKLDAIIYIILAGRPIAVKHKVELLSKFQISNKDISRVVGISESHVKKEKSLAKKERSKIEQDC